MRHNYIVDTITLYICKYAINTTTLDVLNKVKIGIATNNKVILIHN